MIETYDEVNENPFPVIQLHEGNLAVYSGQEIELIYENGDSFQWYESKTSDFDSGIPIKGAVNNTFRVGNIPEKSVKYYYCRSASNESDEFVSDVYTVANTGLVQIRVETVDGEEPTCKKANPPADWYWGKSIKNATKVPSSVIMTKGSEKLYDSGDFVENHSGATIRIRGNTSARTGLRIGKVPYKIKLEKKSDLLKYNRSDNTKIGFKIAELCGFAYVPECDFVDLVINGTYRGVYILTEAVEKSENRIDIGEDGFLIERDPYFWNEDLFFSTPDPYNAVVNYTFKYPSNLTADDERFLYIKNYVLDAFVSLVDGAYDSFVDLESFAAWILVHDILGTSDYAGSNIFISKYDSDGSLLKMECPWDFDSIFNSKDTFAPIHKIDTFWFGSLFSSKNKSFLNVYKQKFNEKKTEIYDAIELELRDCLSSKNAENIDFARELEKSVYGRGGKSVYEEISNAEDWFSTRFSWLETNISALD